MIGGHQSQGDDLVLIHLLHRRRRIDRPGCDGFEQAATFDNESGIRCVLFNHLDFIEINRDRTRRINFDNTRTIAGLLNHQSKNRSLALYVEYMLNGRNTDSFALESFHHVDAGAFRI